MKINASTIAQAFRERFATLPELVVRAPGRINLIGEHTDYNGGLVLPAAIDRAIWLAFGKRGDGRLHFYAHDLQDEYRGSIYGIEKSERHWANYLLGVISEAQAEGRHIGGLNVAFGGDVPLGAGLSSSAALESGMIFGLNRLFGLHLQPLDLVKLAQRGENNFVGMNCGIMDMFASMMGRADCVIRLDCRSLDFEYLPFSAPACSLLLCDSGVKHALVDSEYNTRRAECEAGVQLLQAVSPAAQSLRDVTPALLFTEKKRLPAVIFRRCKFVVEEIGRVEAACKVLKNNDLESFGQLMYATHEGLRTEYEVTCPETDFLVDATKQMGAVLGARQMGGGFGGCTLNLVRRDGAELFSQTIKRLYEQKFGKALPCYEVQLTDGVSEALS